MRSRVLLCGILIHFVLLTAVAQAEFIIDVDYTGDSAYQSAFTSAAATWQSLLVGYQDGFVVDTTQGSTSIIGQVFTTVKISASIETIDGAGQVLGQAGPTQVALDRLGYVLATDGMMRFDSADFASLSASTLNSLILHEMGHVLGFGTLWDLNGVYTTDSGQFSGSLATAYWQSEFGQTGSPAVELGGGGGTANGHWNEVDGGGGLTGITDSLGRDMRDELMTGWLNPNSFISDMTVASFADIGFTTKLAAVPEPSGLAMFGSIMTFWMLRRRRQRLRSTIAHRRPTFAPMKNDPKS